MKASTNRIPGRRAIMLTECLVYISMAAFLVGMAMLLFIRCMDSAHHLSRNADDIAGAMSAGERWRADLRRAVQPPGPSRAGEPDLVIPVGEGRYVVYRVENGSLWRSESGDLSWARLLDRVVMAEWNAEPREHVVAWHFDLELATKKPNARLRPLFSFIGVAGSEVHP